ncbi:unnamed protein product [Lampetra fluviatilis]
MPRQRIPRWMAVGPGHSVPQSSSPRTDTPTNPLVTHVFPLMSNPSADLSVSFNEEQRRVACGGGGGKRNRMGDGGWSRKGGGGLASFRGSTDAVARNRRSLETSIRCNAYTSALGRLR